MNPQRLAEAGKTFQGICAGCHGLDGQGSERGPNIASRQEVVRRSDAELLRTLRNGISETGMPNFAALGDPMLEALVRYLRALQGKTRPMPVPGDPKRGETLFSGAAGCSECHILRGKGGFIGSDLTAYAADSSPEEVRHNILKPGGDAQPGRGQVQVTLRSGESILGVVRNEDNFSLQLQSMDGAFHLIQKPEVALMKPAAQPYPHNNFSQTLTAAQLDDLVGYLMTVARSGPDKSTKRQHHDED